jgi:ring-1,2-phenylacetyl-CoA epoxidase subunit PaaE
MLRFHPLKVTQRTELCEDAVSLTFALPQELRESYRFEAGQHIAVRTVIDGMEARRTYSLVSAPGEDELRIGVRVHPDGQVSRFLAQQLKLGEALDVLTPNGSFHTRPDAARGRFHVAFAAGCGITPVLSIAANVLATEPHSRVLLIYGNRSTARTMFLEEALALKDRYLARFSLHFLMSREPQDLELFNGRLDAQKVRELAAGLFNPADVDECYLCGPGSMIEELGAALCDLGIERSRIHAEHFTTATATTSPNPQSPVSDGSPGAVAAAAAVGASSAPEMAEITVVMDGRRRAFSMALNSESILDAADCAGIDLPFSCRAGVCSTCRAKLTRGQVQMAENHALEDWEVAAGFVLCCQARPTSAVIEISYDEQ